MPPLDPPMVCGISAAVADPGLNGGVGQPIIRPNFPVNCVKIKKIELGEACVLVVGPQICQLGIPWIHP